MGYDNEAKEIQLHYNIVQTTQQLSISEQIHSTTIIL